MTESLLLCGIDPPWDLSFGWSQIEAVIELLFLFSSGPTSNHTRIQMRGDQVCDAEFTLDITWTKPKNTDVIHEIELISQFGVSSGVRM